MILRYRAKRTGSPPHSMGIETQPGAQAIDCEQNQTPSFSSRLRRQLQDNPASIEGASGPRSIYRQAGVAVTLLFLLMYSGPPKFRIRDPEASLRGDIDWVVVLHIFVWGLAGAWVFFEIGKHGRTRPLLKRFSLPQKLGLAMILCLALSAVVSKAPALSVSKIYQMAISLFFMQLFVEHFGHKSCLKKLAYLACALTLALYAYHRLPSISQYRQPEDVANLGDRIGLWSYLSNITLTQSPWLGLGYYSASRVYGPEYNPGLGSAHSMFFEILIGGGVLSLALFIALCILLSVYAVYLLYRNKDHLSFAVATLFFASIIFGSMGDEIDSGPVAMCFWYSASALPLLYERSLKRTPQARGVQTHATA